MYIFAEHIKSLFFIKLKPHNGAAKCALGKHICETSSSVKLWILIVISTIISQVVTLLYNRDAMNMYYNMLAEHIK